MMWLLAQRLTLFAVVSLLWQTAVAGAPDSASVSQLVAGLNHPLPPYQAGMKFRTPESMEHALAEEAARSLGATLMTRAANERDMTGLLSSRKANMVMAFIPEGTPMLREKHVIPTGYSAGPMAIMRTDTTIRTWQDLRGRTVCVAEGSPYAAMSARRYGAIEKIYPAPADSLLALRIGDCDAAVHDSALLEQLLKLPEWKKFSARLAVGQRSVLAFVTHGTDTALAAHLVQLTAQWQKSSHLAKLNEKRVKHIAFEVYLDQNVPDCH